MSPSCSITVLLAALSGAACSHDASENVARNSEAVWYGEPSGESDDGVVFLSAEASRVIAQCTATLVARNLVITARHCVAEFSNEPFSCTSEGELTAGSRGGTMGALLSPEKISVFLGRDPDTRAPAAAVGQQIFSVSTPSICRNDIAMVLLDRDVPGVPLWPIRFGKGNSRGELLRVVGYGLDENLDVGLRNTRSGLSIVQVGRSEFLEDGDPVPPRTFVTVGPTLCYGDSGGPAFSENGAVTAVWSQIVGNCGDSDARNVFTQVAPFEDTIVRPAFEAAGAEPLPEVEDMPGSGGAPAAEAGAGGEGPGATGGRADSGAGGAPAAGAPTAEAGTSSEPSDAGVGGQPEPEPPTYRGPRKEGGLQCGLAPNGRQNRHAALTALIGLALLARRARSKERGA